MTISKQEILNIAVDMEETGYRFYKTQSEQVKDKNLKNIFITLANEELKHKEIFNGLFSHANEPSGDYNDEYFRYLRTITRHDEIFKDKKKKKSFFKSGLPLMDIFNAAIDAEKDSILFYSELKQLYLPDKESLAIISGIIAEEKKHIITIRNLMDNQ